MTPHTPIMNGDHAEFEQEWAGKDPRGRPDWPLPSFDAADWAEAFCKLFSVTMGGKQVTEPEGLMIGWFANSLMRGFNEHARRAANLHSQEQGWRPIAGAPQNQRVLIYKLHEAGGCDQTAMAYLSSGDGLWITMPEEHIVGFVPTHWQPLPSPPKADSTDPA